MIYFQRIDLIFYFHSGVSINMADDKDNKKLDLISSLQKTVQKPEEQKVK